MRILAACSLGGMGHLNPLLPFLAAARRNGHETLVIGPPAMGAEVTGRGVRFWSGGEPSEEEIAPIREKLPVVPAGEATVLGNRELFGRMAAGAMLPAMREAFADWGPDLVLRDPCEYASAAVAASYGIPTATVAISLAAAEGGSIAAASPALEEHLPGLTELLMASPYLSRLPASLDPSPFSCTLRYREGLTAARRGRGSRPFVYITFGTVLGYMTIAGEVFRTALDAAGEVDAEVLMTVGTRFDPASLGPLPGNVRVEPWVEQAHVLPRADLVVCHGGSGTTYGALAAGVPLVVVPVFADQFVNSQVVAASGAGVVAGPRAPAIAAAMVTVLQESQYREAAGRVAGEMAGAPAVDEVLSRLLALRPASPSPLRHGSPL
jgi:UDP:flavonoid glycosyltransferase YjiC (YdhE family)